MTRHASLLIAVLLTVLQPALAMCQCVGCSGSEVAQQAAAKSCCHTAAHTSPKSCCGATAEPCACGGKSADHNSQHSNSNAHTSGSACQCSSQPRPAAVSTDVVQIDHPTVGHHAFFAVAPSCDVALVRAHAAQLSTDGSPPGCYGGLRVHAFLGVWLI